MLGETSPQKDAPRRDWFKSLVRNHPRGKIKKLAGSVAESFQNMFGDFVHTLAGCVYPLKMLCLLSVGCLRVVLENLLIVLLVVW